MNCAYCGRPLCEDFVTGDLMTGDSNKRCGKSPDWRHHLEKRFTYRGNDAAIVRDAYQVVAGCLRDLSPGMPDWRSVRAVIAITDDWLDSGAPGDIKIFARNWWEANGRDYR